MTWTFKAVCTLAVAPICTTHRMMSRPEPIRPIYRLGGIVIECEANIFNE
jgi:hypothetical protein